VLLTRSPLPPKGTLDLHVLSPPLAFALSQDQTLQFGVFGACEQTPILDVSDEDCSPMLILFSHELLAFPILSNGSRRLVEHWLCSTRAATCFSKTGRHLPNRIDFAASRLDTLSPRRDRAVRGPGVQAPPQGGRIS
jgi:hypothetical protein